MYKFFFLINPVSGGGQGKVIHKFLPEIMESMDFKSDEVVWGINANGLEPKDYLC